MKYKGVEYTVVQMVDRLAMGSYVWRRQKQIRRDPVSRAAATKAAEYQIDRVVRDK